MPFRGRGAPLVCKLRLPAQAGEGPDVLAICRHLGLRNEKESAVKKHREAVSIDGDAQIANPFPSAGSAKLTGTKRNPV